MDLVPNLFDEYYVDNDGIDKVKDKFLAEEVPSHFLSNCGPSIIIFGGYIILFILSRLIDGKIKVKAV